MAPSLSRFLWPCCDKLQVAMRANCNAIFGLAWSWWCFASAHWSWSGWGLGLSKSNWMNQHRQIDITNTPRRPMNSFGHPRVPQAVSNPPPRHLAGWTQVPGTCGFNSWECSWERRGNLRFMPCKKIGFHGKFLGIVPFCCLEPCKQIYFPRSFLQCSQELVQKFPGTVPGSFLSCAQVAVFKQERGWDLLVEKIRAWNHEWVWPWGLKVLSKFLPLMMAIPDDERSDNNSIPKNQKQGGHAKALVRLANASVTGWEQGSRDIRKSMQQIQNLLRVFFFCAYLP